MMVIRQWHAIINNFTAQIITFTYLFTDLQYK
jgi:hypothetical protein